jgi:autoinducer 2-degrading protein
MLIRIVKMSFHPENVPEFLEIFENSKEKIRNRDGCRLLELYGDQQNPNVYFTYSHWESEEDLNTYRKSELFGGVWPTTKKLFDKKPEAWSVDRLYNSEKAKG